MDWFLYDNGLRHERVKCHRCTIILCSYILSYLMIWDIDLNKKIKRNKQDCFFDKNNLYLVLIKRIFLGIFQRFFVQQIIYGSFFSKTSIQSVSVISIYKQEFVISLGIYWNSKIQVLRMSMKCHPNLVKYLRWNFLEYTDKKKLRILTLFTHMVLVIII